MARKQLLILHAGQFASGRTFALADAASRAALAAESDIGVTCLPALQAGLDALLQADGVLFVTPEKFGYMAGAMKDFFDRTFYPAQGKLAGLPYALIVVAGNDGSGAISAVERIARGYPLKPIAAPLLLHGELGEADMTAAGELAASFASGLMLGIF